MLQTVSGLDVALFEIT